MGLPIFQIEGLVIQDAKRLVRLSSYRVAMRHLVDDRSIAQCAGRYLAIGVYRIQAYNVYKAKSRVLAGFAQWFVPFNGHGDVGAYLPRDTQLYLSRLK